jgi:SOS response regulatory protein OraA/RecX
VKEANLTSDVMKKILSAKTTEELVTNLSNEGIIKDAEEAAAIINSTEDSLSDTETVI